MTDTESQNAPAEKATQDAPLDLAGRGPRVEFLDRAGYRQRRIRDAACVLPVVAIVLMVLPLMWPRETAEQSLTSLGMIYLFGLWVVLIIAALILARVLRFSGTENISGATNAAPDGVPEAGADE